MKVARFIYEKEIRMGIVTDNNHARLIEGDVFGSYEETDMRVDLNDAHMLAPVHPTKVVCAGLNYRKHAEEMQSRIPQEPLFFLKPETAVIGTDRPIFIPNGVGRVDFEAELAVVIARDCFEIKEEDADSVIFGYTCANDVTARDVQRREGQWTRAKAYDTFCPLGPFIETDVDPSDLAIRAIVNGVALQDSRTSDFIFSIARIVSAASTVMTLRKGDVILTGTPSGVGAIREGDTVSVEIEGIGTLTNGVVARR